MTVSVIIGDCIEVLRGMPAESVHCCVTSPPYWGLRDYGHAGQLGLEPTLDEYVAHMVRVFQELWRVLRDDATLWLNIGDSYVGRGRGGGAQNCKQKTNVGSLDAAVNVRVAGLKPKDLCGIPWRVAFALQADGWYLRSDIIWSKPNSMPESVIDRPTKSHEYIFLLSKSERYYYDAAAIAEDVSDNSHGGGGPNPGAKALDLGNHVGGYLGQTVEQRVNRSGNKACVYAPDYGRPDDHLARGIPWEGTKRNKRTVWNVLTKPFHGAHFATFPPDLVEPCILAGCPVGGTVLDPFGGAGTTGLVADRLQRNAILIELNPAYAAMARERIAQDSPLFAEVTS